MAVVVLTCPHCASEKMAFDLHGAYSWSFDPSIEESRIWNAFCMCRKCQEGVIIKLGSYDDSVRPIDCLGDPRDEGFYELSMYPDLQPNVAPEHVPNDIDRDFIEAMDNLKRQNWTSAGMMFRKVLQRATSRIAPEDVDFGAMRLFKRINTLEERRLITPAMKEWAHKIRLDGNEATHEEDEDFSSEQAKLMKEFTELFLIYSFTLPARIAASNKATESEV